MLLQIGDLANIDLVRQLVQAHAYWRLKGLATDLIIWNEDRAGYRQLLQDRIMGLIAAGVEAQVIDRPGGIFVRRADQISAEDRLLLQSVARAIISDERGPLSEQIASRRAAPVRVEGLKIARATWTEPAVTEALPRQTLMFDNGLGGLPVGAVRRALDALAAQYANGEDRLQIRAYAASTVSDGGSGARRLSLTRALAVRQYLIDKGIRSTRIDVRALGAPTDGSTADRVEVAPVGR